MPGTYRQERALRVLVGQLYERRVEAPAGDAPGHKVVCNNQCIPSYGPQEVLGCSHTQEIVRERTLIPATGSEARLTNHLTIQRQRKLGQKNSFAVRSAP